MRKHWITLTLVSVLLLLMVGVASAGTLESWAEAVKAKNSGAEITIAMATHPSTEAFQKMADEFEALTGIKVKWDVMEEIYLHDKSLTEHAAGTGRYDVLMMDVCWIGEYAAKRVIDPLDSYLADPEAAPAWFDYEDIVSAYRSGLGVYKDQVYGIPSAGESAFIAYRKDLFEKYGYDPSKIQTYDDLLVAAEFFTGKEPDLYGISMRGRRGHHIDYAWFQFLYPFGGYVFQPGTYEPAINSPESVKSLEYYCKLMAYAPKGIENFSHEEATTSFMQGKSAMWFDATALAPWIENAEKSAVAGQVGYMPPLEGPEGAYAAVAGWNLALSSKSKNKDAAWAFIMFMTSKAKSAEYVQKGGVVTRTSVLTAPEFIEEYPYYPEILDSLELADSLVQRDIDWRPRIPEWPKIGEIIGLQGSLALTGQSTPQAACEQAAKEIRELMETKGYYKK
ncbi:MAG: sugar ABC transporter substrate-binding protein [Firmicutes bacterium]|nr:sugar ABC transporter substrate-binding protein [Bacillota bacterium]